MKLKAVLVMALVLVMGAVFVSAATAAESDEMVYFSTNPTLSQEVEDSVVFAVPSIGAILEDRGDHFVLIDELPDDFIFPEIEAADFRHFIALWDELYAIPVAESLFITFVENSGLVYQGYANLMSQPMLDAETDLWGAVFEGFLPIAELDLDTVDGVILFENDLPATINVAAMDFGTLFGSFFSGWNSEEFVPDSHKFEILALDGNHIFTLSRAGEPVIEAWGRTWGAPFEGFVTFDTPILVSATEHTLMSPYAIPAEFAGADENSLIMINISDLDTGEITWNPNFSDEEIARYSELLDSVSTSETSEVSTPLEDFEDFVVFRIIDENGEILAEIVSDSEVPDTQMITRIQVENGADLTVTPNETAEIVLPSFDVADSVPDLAAEVVRLIFRWDDLSEVPSEFFVTIAAEDGFTYQGELSLFSSPRLDEETGLWGGIFTGVVETVDLRTFSSWITFERGEAAPTILDEMSIQTFHIGWKSADLVPDSHIFEVFGMYDSRFVVLERISEPYFSETSLTWGAEFGGFVAFDTPLTINANGHNPIIPTEIDPDYAGVYDNSGVGISFMNLETGEVVWNPILTVEEEIARYSELLGIE